MDNVDWNARFSGLDGRAKKGKISHRSHALRNRGSPYLVGTLFRSLSNGVARIAVDIFGLGGLYFHLEYDTSSFGGGQLAFFTAGET